MIEEPAAAPLPRAPHDGDEIHWDLLSLLRKLIAGSGTIVLTTLAGLLLATAYAFYLAPIYSAEAVFLPPKDTDIPSEGAASLVFGAGDVSDTYLGRLGSRTVADDIIDHLGLMAVYGAKTRTDAHIQLAQSSKFSVLKNSLINVEVQSGDPKLAAAIANAYLEALYRLNGQMINSASDHRRAFFEDQLTRQKASLAQAEEDLKHVQERTGLVIPQGEAQAGINATAQLQADIGAAETRLAGLRVSETEQNSEVVQARSQLAQLRSELARQQSDSGRRGPGGGLATTGQLPELTLEIAEKEREVKLRETLYNALVAQYERARLASLDPGPQLQIVDRAVVPERKSGPARKQIGFLGLIFGFVAGLSRVLLAHPLRRAVRAIRQPAPAPAPAPPR